jgi:hypothetical protein
MNADAEEQKKPGHRAGLSAFICVHLRFDFKKGNAP